MPPSKATDPDSERYLLFAAAVGLLTAVSRHDPIVLVLDDLQWADSGSLALLRHLTAAERVHAGVGTRDVSRQRATPVPGTPGNPRDALAP